MIQLKKLWRLTEGTFNILLVFLYVLYLYGIVGFIQASRGKSTRNIDDYVLPLIWNFIGIATTLIIIF